MLNDTSTALQTELIQSLNVVHTHAMSSGRIALAVKLKYRLPEIFEKPQPPSLCFNTPQKQFRYAELPPRFVIEKLFFFFP